MFSHAIYVFKVWYWSCEVDDSILQLSAGTESGPKSNTCKVLEFMCNFQPMGKSSKINIDMYVIPTLGLSSLMDLLCYGSANSYFNLAEAINVIFYCFICFDALIFLNICNKCFFFCFIKN